MIFTKTWQSKYEEVILNLLMMLVVAKLFTLKIGDAIFEYHNLLQRIPKHGKQHCHRKTYFMESTFYLVQLIFCKVGQFLVADNVFSSILGQIRMICKVSFLGYIFIFIKFLFHTHNLTRTILLMIFTFTMFRKISKNISKLKFPSFNGIYIIHNAQSESKCS